MNINTKQIRLIAAIIAATVTTGVLADTIERSPNIKGAGDPGMSLAANASNPSTAAKTSLYTRLGGYDAIAAVINDTLPRLIADPTLGRFWANRGADGIKREKQLVIDFIVNQAGGPLNYGGREMVTAHKGMKISADDWKIFMGHLNDTLEKFKLPSQEKTDVVAFMESLKDKIVE